MRYLVGFVLALALAALPQSASAQDAEAATASEPSFQEPSSEPASEEPALQLRLDEAGAEVVPTLPQAVDGYTLDQMELRLKRARIGLLSSGGVTLAGMGLVIAGARVSNTQPSSDGKPEDALKFSGVSLLVAGIAGMIASGNVLRTRRRQLDRYEPALRSPPGGYTLEEMDRRVRRARIGLGVSIVAMTPSAPELALELRRTPYA